MQNTYGTVKLLTVDQEIRVFWSLFTSVLHKIIIMLCGSISIALFIKFCFMCI